MSVKECLKRAVIYIVKGVPVKKVTTSIVQIAPNELLKGRVALLTGGTSGIGFAIANAFLKSGASVVITGRNESRIQDSCKKLLQNKDFQNRIFGVVMDNTDVAGFETCFQNILSLLDGRNVDILINNAGIRGGHIATVTEADYDMILDTNLKAVFFLSRLVGKYMKENKITGNILNIISSSGLRPAASAYTLSKWGVRGLTLGLAKSLIPYDIVVNGLAPGPTATPMLMKDGSEEIGHTSNPLGRYAMPEEIANMAVVLTSGMGRTVVGDIVYMTGGAGIITFDDMDYKF